MIFVCIAKTFAAEKVILGKICVKICKKPGKFAQNGQEKNAEKGRKSGKNESNLGLFHQKMSLGVEWKLN